MAPKKYENLSFVELDVLLWRAECSLEVYLAIHKGLRRNIIALTEGKKEFYYFKFLILASIRIQLMHNTLLRPP
jgi:hypothetical protein